MTTVTLGALAAHFGRDVERAVSKALGIIEAAAREGVDLLVFPDAALGGYIGDLRAPDVDDLPPTLDRDGPELAAIAAAAGKMVVCIGYAEAADGVRYNSAVCVNGDGVLGTHRKVHQPAGESLAYTAGDRFEAFDTPIGRLGMLIDYDKTFPESARTLALDGATTIAFLPLVSASSGRSGRQLRNSCAVSHDPVRITRSTAGCEMSAWPSPPSSMSTRASSSFFSVSSGSTPFMGVTKA